MSYRKQPHWTLHTTAESADVKCKTFVVGSNITCIVYCNCTVAATLCTVGTPSVSLGCIIVNSVHTGDSVIIIIIIIIIKL